MAAPHGTAETVHGAADAAHGAADAAHDGAAAFPPFDGALFASQLFWFAVTFGLLYLFVSRFALPKVAAVLEARAATLKADLDHAHRESEAAEKARLEMERVSAEARASARGVIEKMRAEAQAELGAEQAKSDAELAAKAAEAEAQIADRRAKALAQVDAIAKDLAGEIVAKLTGGASAARQKVRA